MKTKFILHGGFNPQAKQQDDAFFSEILKNTPEAVKILLVYFAKDADTVTQKRDEDIRRFENNKGNRMLIFNVADERLFLEQAQWAEIIYLHGGSSTKLLDALKNFKDLKKIFEGKIVAGDSAGANVLVSVFYSKRDDKAMYGLGLIPIKIICHYCEGYKNKLDGMEPSLKTLLLQEYEFRVFYS